VSAPSGQVEGLLRELAPRVLGGIVRRHGDFADAEDAVQEALVAAAQQWPAEGVPDDPRSWLTTVASRRLTDMWRRDSARHQREMLAAVREPATPAQVSDVDDSLALLFLCCHPVLPAVSAIPLTLRAVGGLTTAEIARAFLVPEPTMGKRISRAKHRIRESAVPFRMPSPEEWPSRLRAVLHVVYLIFNEGYSASSGEDVVRQHLSAEAIRLARLLFESLPDQPEAAGLLALMLLTDARRPARTGRHGELVPLAEQDRALWNQALIAEGVALISHALPRQRAGYYQIQAAIAAIHDEAKTADDTDWPQILALYNLLARISANPMVTLNRAIAAAMVNGPRAGLAMLAPLDAQLAASHRLAAVRAHLLEMAGNHEAAIKQYRVAANRTTSDAERHYLMTRAAKLMRGAEARAEADRDRIQ
jgi:predicted RNA polymerase sigma factor